MEATIVVVSLAVAVAVPVVMQLAISLERAEFHFGSGRETKADASQLVQCRAPAVRGCEHSVVAAACVVANITMNAKAGFRSRNVEIASTVCIAYADYSTASGSVVTIASAACAPEIATSDAAEPIRIVLILINASPIDELDAIDIFIHNDLSIL